MTLSGGEPCYVLADDFSTNTAYLPPEQVSVVKETSTDNSSMITTINMERKREEGDAQRGRAATELAGVHKALKRQLGSLASRGLGVLAQGV